MLPPRVIFRMKTTFDQDTPTHASALNRMPHEGLRSDPSLQKILCIAAITLTFDGPTKRWCVLEAASLNAGSGDEKQLIASFTNYLDKMRPVLVGYNSKEVDIPILRARAMLHNVTCVYMMPCRHSRQTVFDLDLFEMLSQGDKEKSYNCPPTSLIHPAARRGLPVASEPDGRGNHLEHQDSADDCMREAADIALLFLENEFPSRKADRNFLSQARDVMADVYRFVCNEKPESFMQFNFPRFGQIG